MKIHLKVQIKTLRDAESRSVNIDTENDFLLAASIIKNKINKDDNG